MKKLLLFSWLIVAIVSNVWGQSMMEYEDNAYFVIATTSMNDDHGYVKTMGTMAGSFGLHD